LFFRCSGVFRPSDSRLLSEELSLSFFPSSVGTGKISEVLVLNEGGISGVSQCASAAKEGLKTGAWCIEGIENDASWNGGQCVGASSRLLADPEGTYDSVY
jgi:hypothetical protein